MIFHLLDERVENDRPESEVVLGHAHSHDVKQGDT
jgi:hypothetical protein